MGMTSYVSHFYQKPIPAMQGLAERAPLIYAGSVSRTLFPALHLGETAVRSTGMRTLARMPAGVPQPR
jgi:DNA-binding transcriptional MocR family regulator